MSSPVAIARHESHLRHGLVVGPSLDRQLSDLARMRAIDVLPVPRVPVNRNAWAIRPDSIARLSVLATWSCPTTSSKVRERYFRASTSYDMGRNYRSAPDGNIGCRPRATGTATATPECGFYGIAQILLAQLNPPRASTDKS